MFVNNYDYFLRIPSCSYHQEKHPGHRISWRSQQQPNFRSYILRPRPDHHIDHHSTSKPNNITRWGPNQRISSASPSPGNSSFGARSLISHQPDITYDVWKTSTPYIQETLAQPTWTITSAVVDIIIYSSVFLEISRSGVV